VLDKELATWKQRAESTPTELDDMLNDITTKNNNLDRTIEELKAEIRAMEIKHKSDLDDREAIIETLRNELALSKAQESDVCIERDTLRDDMTALSEAYTNLETEYRRQLAATITAATDVPSASTDDNVLQIQIDNIQESGAQLETQAVSPNVGSTEVSTLRAENERMRQEAQAADEWMSMAVERMQTMTNETSSLQEQVTTLTRQLQDNPTLGTNPTVTDLNNENHANELLLLQKSIDDLQVELNINRVEIETIVQREAMEISVRDTRIQEFDVIIHNANELIEQLQNELRQLHDANDSAQQWMSKAVEHHQILAEQVTSLSQQNLELQATLHKREHDGEPSNDTIVSHLQSELDRKDAEMNNLKELITGYQNQIQDSHAQEVVIAQLENDLNDLKAHLDRVSSQLEAKEREIEDLHSQIQAPNLGQVHEDQSMMVESLKSELESRTNQITLLTNEIEELQTSNRELQEKLDDLDTIRIEAGTKEEEILALRARMAESEARKEAIQNILDAVAKEKEELATEFDKNQRALEKIESELNKMRRGDLDTTQSTEIEENLDELQETIKTLEAQLVSQCDEATSVVQQWEETYAALQTDYTELEGKLRLAIEEKSKLEPELFDAKEVVVKLQDELNALKDSQNARISTLESLAENLKDQLQDQENDANDTINQWQENYSEIESKLQAVISEKTSLLSQLREIEASSKSADTNIDGKEAELIQRIQSLEEQLVEQEQEATAIVAQWQDCYNNIEMKFNELSLEHEKLVTEFKNINEPEPTPPENEVVLNLDKVNENNDDQLAELVLQIKNLEEQLSDQEQEAADIVQQWQASYTAIEASLNATIEEKNILVKQLADVRDAYDDPATAIRKVPFVDINEVVKLQSKIEELEDTVKQLEVQLTSHEEEAKSVVGQWQQCYNDAVTQQEVTSLELQNAKEALESAQSKYEGSNKDADPSPTLDETKGSALKANNKEMDQNFVEHEVKVGESQIEIKQNEATEIVRSLEAEISNLQQKLVNQTEDSLSLSLTWQKSYDDMSSKYYALEQENELLSREISEVNATYLSPQSKFEDVSTSADRAIILQETVAESTSRISTFQQQNAALTNELYQLKESYSSLQSRFDEVSSIADRAVILEKDLAESSRSISDLQQELATLHLEKDSLTKELEQLKVTNFSFQSKFDEVSTTADRAIILEKELTESSNTIYNLQQQLDALNDIVNQWQESHSHITDELKTAMLELQERRDTSAVQKKQLDDAVSSAESNCRELENAKSQLELDKETILYLEAQIKLFNTEISKWQQSHNEISASMAETVEKNTTLQSSLDAFELQYVEKIKEYELEISSWKQKEVEMAKQVNDTLENKNIQSSINSYEDLRENYEQTLAKVDDLNKSILMHSGQLQKRDDEVKELLLKNDDLVQKINIKEEKLAELETQLIEQEEDARNIVMQWQQSYEALQVHCEETMAELESCRDTITNLQSQLDTRILSSPTSTNRETEVEDQPGHVQYLDAKIAKLQAQLVQEADHAKGAIEQWQTECTNVASDLAFALGENEDLASKLQEAEVALSSSTKLQQESEKVVATELQGKVDELTHVYGQVLLENEDLRKRTLELEAEVGKLRTKITEQHEHETKLKSDTVILENRVSDHLTTVAQLKQTIESMKNEKNQLQETIAKLTEDFDFQLEKLRADSVRMRESFDSQHRTDQETLKLVEGEVEGLRQANMALIRERDTVSLRLAETEDKVVEANNTLQILMTDQASKEATDLAAEALRDEIRSMHSQAQVDRMTIVELSQARDDAEAESEKLQNEIASFLGYDSYENNRTVIERQAMEATEGLQRAERDEIRALKSSLSRALYELAASRGSEQELEERAAKATHQASMYEQELVKSKSDFQFLTQTMDEMREAESSRRLSLEYRITSLENEQNVLRHYHNTEIEHVRNELNHISLERDRLFQSLKESEKSKEMLLQAPSRDRVMNGDERGNDPFVELNRLRLEKAQLLSAAAEDASRMEHRLREAHAAAKASADAEIFMERELRLQAEKTLERTQLEMSELRMVGMDKRHGLHNIELLEQQNENLQNELQRQRTETQSTRAECSSLRQQLHETKKESNLTFVRLTQECQQAKARSSQLVREGQYEAEIRVEVARLQATKSSATRNSPERGLVLIDKTTNKNPALDDDGSCNVTVAKLYDALQKQKQATEEERIIYFELLNEHDNLLALLAQQDLLKSSYQRTLLRICGKDAVNTAIREAEEQAQSQYGKYIQLK
jgi:chromosome segregation ATPase